MVALKDNEMVLTRQRNTRLRHIQDELNILEQLKNSTLRHNREIIDPEYAPDEIPGSIVKVICSCCPLRTHFYSFLHLY